MMDKMANHASRIRRYMARWGKEKVTEFIDHCLRIETLIDSNNAWKSKKINKAVIQDQRTYRHVDRWKHEHNYMDDWINSKESEWMKRGRGSRKKIIADQTRPVHQANQGYLWISEEQCSYETVAARYHQYAL
jgi:spore cortex formation protein SpoVR/YcgB (stage V sporulation)